VRTLAAASLLVLAGLVTLCGCAGRPAARSGTASPAAAPTSGPSAGPRTLRIALLHLAPRPGALDYDARLIRTAVRAAAGHGADWCVTPELAVSGYEFRARIGLGWIPGVESSRVDDLARLARSEDVCLFVGMPTRDVAGALRNSVVVMDRRGELRGVYHKHAVIPGSVEGWAAPGHRTGVYTLDGVRAGVLVCADAWLPRFSRQTAAAGADILVAPSCWSPGDMGPHGVWERDSRVTGLPLVVCNTTGRAPSGDQRRNVSVVDAAGRRLFTFRSPRSAVFLVDWDVGAGTFARAGTLYPAL
jgi:predicted amidohydrolase